MITKLSYEREINPVECALILEDFKNNKPHGMTECHLSEPFMKCGNEWFERGEN